MNFSYTENPSYLDLGVGIYKAVRWHYRPDNWVNYSFPSSFFADFKKYYYFPFEETLPIFYWSVIFTVARYIFESFVCRPLTRILKLNNKSDIEKFPESFWKLVAYSFLWSNCSYLLLLSQKHDYFTNPYGIWDDWEAGMAVPYDVKFLYFIECGFYLHSIYATIYMDAVRKDFVVMLLHHVLTITLISISYATRYHKIGVLVIFVHDVTDILLEFTKCNVYLKNRGGKFYPFHEHLSNIGFASFAFAWFLFRLYWYPLKILYSSGVVAVHRAYFRGAGLYAFFNSLLWILLLMDIYWFYFIVLFLYKVATGQLSEISDTRELEEEEAAAAMRAKNGEKVKKEE